MNQHTRAVVLRTIIYIDRAGLNLSAQELSSKIFFDLDDFGETLHGLLLEGEIVDIDYKVYPVPSYNLTEVLFQKIMGDVDDNEGGMAS